MYLHPIIIEVIKSALFSGATSIGVKHPKFFPDVLPLPTLALALTAVRVSLFAVLGHLLKSCHRSNSLFVRTGHQAQSSPRMSTRQTTTYTCSSSTSSRRSFSTSSAPPRSQSPTAPRSWRVSAVSSCPRPGSFRVSLVIRRLPYFITQTSQGIQGFELSAYCQEGCSS
jgi:hypothetical protein